MSEGNTNERKSHKKRNIAIVVAIVLAVLFIPIPHFGPLNTLAVTALPNGNRAFTVGLNDAAPLTEHLGTGNFQVHGWVDAVAYHKDGTIFWQSHHSNLIVTAGKDWIAPQLGSTSPGANGANYIALSTNTKAPAAADTCISTTDGGTTSAEITDGNGLARAQGSYAHTGAASSFTISKTFTATGTYTAVHRAGLVTAAANGDTCAGGNDGTMIAQTAFSNDVTLVSGDTLAVTWTVNF